MEIIIYMMIVICNCKKIYGNGVDDFVRCCFVVVYIVLESFGLFIVCVSIVVLIKVYNVVIVCV